MVVVDEAATRTRRSSGRIEHKPDVVLIDVTMPGESGIEAIPKLLEASPGDEGARALDARRPALRARGLRGRRERLRAQGGGRRRARRGDPRGRGGRQLRQPGARRPHGRRRGEGATPRREADPLSEREHEVLRLLALGHTNQEIAKTLFISVRTAETHRAHIMQKLGLASRAELVRYALHRQILALRPSAAKIRAPRAAVGAEAMLAGGQRRLRASLRPRRCLEHAQPCRSAAELEATPYHGLCRPARAASAAWRNADAARRRRRSASGHARAPGSGRARRPRAAPRRAARAGAGGRRARRRRRPARRGSRRRAGRPCRSRRARRRRRR